MNNQDKLDYLEIEFERRKKLPRLVKNNINTVIFQNLITAAILTSYFCIVDVVFFKVDGNTFETFLKYFSLIMAAITIITFEKAYKARSIKLMSFGIEFLFSGILSLYIPYIYLHTDVKTRFIVMVMPAILVVYYLIKSLFIYKEKQIQYRSENMSDVKEILKYDEEG